MGKIEAAEEKIVAMNIMGKDPSNIDLFAHGLAAVHEHTIEENLESRDTKRRKRFAEQK